MNKIKVESVEEFAARLRDDARRIEARERFQIWGGIALFVLCLTGLAAVLSH